MHKKPADLWQDTCP